MYKIQKTILNLRGGLGNINFPLRRGKNEGSLFFSNVNTREEKKSQ
jgi:hypothetical protein